METTGIRLEAPTHRAEWVPPQEPPGGPAPEEIPASSPDEGPLAPTEVPTQPDEVPPATPPERQGLNMESCLVLRQNHCDGVPDRPYRPWRKRRASIPAVSAAPMASSTQRASW